MTQLDDLHANPENPRAAWTPDQLVAFRESLERFGDLGGIVFNRTSGHLVGGHKRVEVFRTAAVARVETIAQPRDPQGTVAHGVVFVDGTRFSYREVEWPPEIELAANLAANRWAAEWDWPKVSAALQQLATADTALLGLTGFASHELETLLAADWTPAVRGALHEDPADGAPDLVTITLTPDQYAVLARAKAVILASEGDDPAPLSDGRVVELVCAEFLSGVVEEG
jgi:hypothetical protein